MLPASGPVRARRRVRCARFACIATALCCSLLALPSGAGSQPSLGGHGPAAVGAHPSRRPGAPAPQPIAGAARTGAAQGGAARTGAAQGGAARAAAPGTAARCPWATASGSAGQSPQQLAAEVLDHMDLAEKLELVVIHYHGRAYQNELHGFGQLCIPPFVLEDGAAGVAYNSSGVTQLPAPLGVAASFDTGLATDYGQVEGEEARHKGIDVLQSPNLNLVRVPENGRAFETYGEDPTLASDLGVAAIEGIQSTGVVAEATHLGAYSQETDRAPLDQVVSQRALQEVYLAPFRAAVEEAGVGAVMCAYGETNGVRDCENPALIGELGSWGFQGLVRSDLSAVDNFAAAFNAGVDAVKPGGHTTLRDLIEEHRLSVQRLDDAVTSILETMFRFNLIVRPFHKQPLVPVATPADAALALRAAEESMVLLQNRGGLLPLSQHTASVAVIGSDAGSGAVSAGQGGAFVVPPFLSTPLSAITAQLAAGATVRFVPGSSLTSPLPPIPAAAVRSRSVDLAASSLVARSISPAQPAGASGASSPGSLPATGPATGGHSAQQVLDQLVSSGAVGTGSIPPNDFADLDHLEEVVVPPASGLYAISVSGQGDQWLQLDGRPLFSDPGTHFASTWQVTAQLQAGKRYTLSLYWFPQPVEGEPTIGWQDETPDIDQAVAAAGSADVAIVFAEAPSGEGADRPDLSLPGAQDALISAVAAANPRTVVVLNTPGAVLMPWLHSVAAVLEAFYPGEQDGTATAAVLFGSVDPSGRLPVTFPADGDGVQGGTASTWPGVDGKVVFGEGLDIGYRDDAAEHLEPLFPFGFGLSYTTFSLDKLTLHPPPSSSSTPPPSPSSTPPPGSSSPSPGSSSTPPPGQSSTPSPRSSPGGVSLDVSVTDTGTRAGTEVVQAYLSFPASAGEPPIQLVAFGRVGLLPGQSNLVTLQVPQSAFQAYLDGKFQTVPGTYELRVGTSSEDLPLSVALQAPTPSGQTGTSHAH